MMHQQISKKIFIYLFIFLNLVTITNNKFSNDIYTIKKFDIIGLNYQETKKLIEDLKIFKNMSIFSLNKKNFFDIINSNKIIEEFTIFKIYPSTMKINVKKTDFLAVTKKNGIDFAVLGNGNLIQIEDNNLNLPFIFGNINAQNFLEFKELIEISHFNFKEIKELYFFKSNRWDILTTNDLLLKMPMDPTVKKLNFIFDIIKDSNFDNVKIIDFRQNDLIIMNE